MLAEIAVTPVDKTAEGYSKYVAEALKIVRGRKDIAYVLTPMSTIVEGEAQVIFDLIAEMHQAVASQSKRVVTSVRIDDRKGVTNALQSKIRSVEEILGEPLNKIKIND